MNANRNISGSVQEKKLRLVPGIVIALMMWLVRFGIPVVAPELVSYCIFGGVLLALSVLVWWGFFSRAPKGERWLAIVTMVAFLSFTSVLLHRSIQTAMMGLLFVFYSIPVLCLAFVAWAIAARRLSKGYRLVTMIAVIFLASGFWVLLRTDGMNGESQQDFKWRWAHSSEDRLLNLVSDKISSILPDTSAMTKEAEWPGFRGPKRNGIVNGVKISADWSVSPPVEIWRKPIGPGCSSFAVHGSFFFTQEQRGEHEMVTCYNLNTGEPVWKHRDKTRFWDSHAGAGPRSTPTLDKGRVYTLGATGILNVLNEYDGKLVWTRNAALDTDVKIPGWGYTSSPLVVDDVVVIAVSGKLLAYDLVSGDLRWSGPNGGESYSSPQLIRPDGIKQVLFMNHDGATSYSPADGSKLWELRFPNGAPVVQPAIIGESDILFGIGDAMTAIKGMRRMEVESGAQGWRITERWTSSDLVPYFNDFVIHKGHVFGFQGPYLTCIDTDKGTRKWKGGRYSGEIILVADSDLLVVFTEKGEVALVKASPEGHRELGRFQAIKGKSWNHPVMVSNMLLIRNSSEMAAFRFPVKGN